MMPKVFRQKGCLWGGVLLMAVVCGCSRPPELGPVANTAALEKIRSSFGAGEGTSVDSPVAASTGTGWATLKGRFTFVGDPPKMSPYAANKDLATCAPGGSAPLQETLLVDGSTQGIANVAIFLRKSSRIHELANLSDEPVVFDQKACRFLTHVLPVGVGQALELKNSDGVGHNTNIEGKNSFNQTIPAGQSLTFVPQKEEAVPQAVRCSIHPWMVAYYLPRENAYVAVTAADGTFEIANLPAGEELEFQVWHESAAGRSGSLVLSSPAAKELNWSNKGRIKIKLEPDEVKEIAIDVPAEAFGG
ncbi:MAG: hypothetical protein ABGX16_10540 [Pirellulales bacterium]